MKTLNSSGEISPSPLKRVISGLARACLDRVLPLVLGVAITRLLLVAHPEQRRLQDVKMTLADQLGKELEEERDEQKADVHAVHVGVRREHHLVVAQAFQPVLDVQARPAAD